MSSKRKERRERAQRYLTDPELLDDIFQHISAGQSLRDYCVVHDIPFSTVQRKLSADPDLEPQYRAAIEARSEVHREQIEALVEQVERGEIDPKAAAVAIGGRQWLAKAMNRKRYGDQQVVDVAVTDKTKLHLEALRMLARRPRREIIATQVDEIVDGTFEVPALEAPQVLPRGSE